MSNDVPLTKEPLKQRWHMIKSNELLEFTLSIYHAGIPGISGYCAHLQVTGLCCFPHGPTYKYEMGIYTKIANIRLHLPAMSIDYHISVFFSHISP